MGIPQRRLSLHRFAQEMRDTDPGFAARVTRFEARYGPVDADLLAVLAQAAYYCWFAQEYARDFAEVCRAIGTGRPTSLYLCTQVTPARWIALHAYVVGVQRWLGADRPLPAAMPRATIERIGQWLGARTPLKERLARLYLRWLCDGLSRYPLSILAGDEAPVGETYEDFAAWYRGDHGPYLGGDYAAEIARCRQAARHRTASATAVEELIHQLVRESQPGCMHRFTRYQDIKIASIGAVRWRGMIPPDTDAPKQAAARYFDHAVSALRAWCRGEAGVDGPGATLPPLLGAHTARKAAIITECFLPPKDDLSAAFYAWISASR